jgi:delta endotoxin, N-terminal domain
MAAPNFQALSQALGNITASTTASINALQGLQADLGTVQQELSNLSNQPTNQNLQIQITQMFNDLRTEIAAR